MVREMYSSFQEEELERMRVDSEGMGEVKTEASPAASPSGASSSSVELLEDDLMDRPVPRGPPTSKGPPSASGSDLGSWSVA